jgi:hypothetical protein
LPRLARVPTTKARNSSSVRAKPERREAGPPKTPPFASPTGRWRRCTGRRPCRPTRRKTARSQARAPKSGPARSLPRGPRRSGRSLYWLRPFMTRRQRRSMHRTTPSMQTTAAPARAGGFPSSMAPGAGVPINHTQAGPSHSAALRALRARRRLHGTGRGDSVTCLTRCLSMPPTRRRHGL